MLLICLGLFIKGEVLVSSVFLLSQLFVYPPLQEGIMERDIWVMQIINN